ncbi:hypothetical protein SCA05_07870 [Staphylococcus carnosus]|nr:hypothetical protein SCA05_07870 [Staphylococcus carnosus]
MTIYNINFGIGWASSGVEYAQAYRAKLLRNFKHPLKFVFIDLIQNENIQTYTENMDFKMMRSFGCISIFQIFLLRRRLIQLMIY